MRRLLTLTVLLIVVLMIVPVAFGQTTKAGKPADFTLRQLTGPPVKLGDYLGKDVIVLHFWATWCDPCLNEMPHLEAMYRRYKDKGFIILGVNTDEAQKQAHVRSEVKTRGLSYPILLDTDKEVLSQMNPSASLPFSVVLSKDGVVAQVSSGYTPGDEKKLDAEVRKLLGLEAADEAEGATDPGTKP